MKTGFRGTFVISWSQTEVDGCKSAPVSELREGASWMWTGEAVRVDGPRGILPLGQSQGEADLRKRAALTVRRIFATARIEMPLVDPAVLQEPLFSKGFTVTDGSDVWDVTVVSTGPGRKPLLMFHGEIPPLARELWIVRHTIDAPLQQEANRPAKGVICFTPGTMIQTPVGPRDVASLAEGDKVTTQDNGTSEILWIGRREVTGARLVAMPALVPIRLRAGALDRDVPDAGLLVSPDHRIVLRGPRARALFNSDEVLVTARDLLDDNAILRDHSCRHVTYIHMMLPRHEVVFANGVATESFHPASAALATMQPQDQARLYDRLPDLRGDPTSYGHHARRVLSTSEAAILHHDAKARSGFAR